MLCANAFAIITRPPIANTADFECESTRRNASNSACCCRLRSFNKLCSISLAAERTMLCSIGVECSVRQVRSRTPSMCPVIGSWIGAPEHEYA